MCLGCSKSFFILVKRPDIKRITDAFFSIEFSIIAIADYLMSFICNVRFFMQVDRILIQ